MSTLGLLFDLDGTMTDTDRHHQAAFNALLEEDGRSIDEAEFKANVMGGANADIMRHLFPALDADRHAALADRKEALFRSLSPTMAPIAGLPELLRWAHERQIPVGVVTNAPRANAVHMLQALGFAHLIDTAVVGEEIARGKPDPLPYTTGAERLGLPAERIVAFEDSRSGLRSALGAGLFAVALTTGLSRDELAALGPDLVIDDYRDPALHVLLERGVGGRAMRD